MPVDRRRLDCQAVRQTMHGFARSSAGSAASSRIGAAPLGPTRHVLLIDDASTLGPRVLHRHRARSDQPRRVPPHRRPLLQSPRCRIGLSDDLDAASPRPICLDDARKPVERVCVARRFPSRRSRALTPQPRVDAAVRLAPPLRALGSVPARPYGQVTTDQPTRSLSATAARSGARWFSRVRRQLRAAIWARPRPIPRNVAKARTGSASRSAIQSSPSPSTSRRARRGPMCVTDKSS